MRTRVSVFACVVLAAAAGCSREQTAEPPVATPSVTLNKDRAAIGSPLRITYKFEPLAERTSTATTRSSSTSWIRKGRSSGRTTTSRRCRRRSGRPGSRSSTPGRSSFRTTRTSARRSSGSVSTTPSTGKRLSLRASRRHPGRSTWFEKLNLLPQSENIFLIYRDGWHPPEIDPNDPTSEWQWTKKNATVAFRNPKKDATFYLELDARPDLFTPPQQVTVTAGGSRSRTFAGRLKDRTLKTFPLTAAQFGDGDMAEIGVEPRSDVQAGWRRRHPRARDPGFPRLRRAEVGRLRGPAARPSATDVQLAPNTSQPAPGACSESSTVAILDTADREW